MASDSLTVGGGGAGFGAALFVRSGTVNIEQSAFQGNSAPGGAPGGDGATSGLGNGGAIFALHSLSANSNGNNLGMPAALPVIASCENSFAMNAASDAFGTDTDNGNTFGTSQSALIDECEVIVTPAPAPALSDIGIWIVGGLFTLLGWLRLRRRRGAAVENPDATDVTFAAASGIRCSRPRTSASTR